jgi:hypothetical protein
MTPAQRMPPRSPQIACMGDLQGMSSRNFAIITLQNICVWGASTGRSCVGQGLATLPTRHHQPTFRYNIVLSEKLMCSFRPPLTNLCECKWFLPAIQTRRHSLMCHGPTMQTQIYMLRILLPSHCNIPLALLRSTKFRWSDFDHSCQRNKKRFEQLSMRSCGHMSALSCKIMEELAHHVTESLAFRTYEWMNGCNGTD